MEHLAHRQCIFLGEGLLKVGVTMFAGHVPAQAGGAYGTMHGRLTKVPCKIGHVQQTSQYFTAPVTQAEADDAADVVQCDVIAALIRCQGCSRTIRDDVASDAIHVQKAAGLTDPESHLRIKYGIRA